MVQIEQGVIPHYYRLMEILGKRFQAGELFTIETHVLSQKEFEILQVKSGSAGFVI